MIFETERLRIRKLRKTDIDGFYDMQSNPLVMEHVKNFMNHSESEIELKKFIDFYDNEDTYYNIWAIEEIANEHFVGICGVYENDKLEFEIAYRLRQMYWKRGFGIEVAKNLIKYCFEKTEIKVLSAYVRVENIGSISILEKTMDFVSEFLCKKTNTYERLYKLKRENWLLETDKSE